MIVEKLRARDSSATATPVVAIVVQRDISASAAVFLEDLLYCICRQLPSAEPESECHFEVYMPACRNGEPAAK
jgi:hypothetical protein